MTHTLQYRTVQYSTVYSTCEMLLSNFFACCVRQVGRKANSTKAAQIFDSTADPTPVPTWRSPFSYVCTTALSRSGRRRAAFAAFSSYSTVQYSIARRRLEQVTESRFGAWSGDGVPVHVGGSGVVVHRMRSVEGERSHKLGCPACCPSHLDARNRQSHGRSHPSPRLATFPLSFSGGAPCADVVSFANEPLVVSGVVFWLGRWSRWPNSRAKVAAPRSRVWR